MTENLYTDLAELYNRIGFGSTVSPELETLLRSLFTEEEATIALNLSPMAPEPPENVAEKTGRDTGEVAEILNSMADKGLIYSSSRGAAKWYKTLQLVPGIFELQFMKGEVTPRAKELAKLFDGYFNAPRPEQAKKSGSAPGVHFARVIPVERTITPEMEIFAYEEVDKYIEASEMITVSVCYCRHEHKLLDKGCDFPDDVCLQFGSFAGFVADRGFGRKIDKTEAREIIKRSAEAGLIHTSSNTKDQIDFICNCCPCCCGILRSVKQSGEPYLSVSSNYVAQVDEDECTACELCADRCQMEAITVEDTAVVNQSRCIGCGVCVMPCATEAISLKAREERVEPPGNFRELIMRQAAQKMEQSQ